MAGISSLFPDFRKQMSVMDRVKIIIQRHKNNYFKNWSTQELVSGIDNTSSNISTIPITILYTSKIYFFLNHNTGTNFYTSIAIAKYRRSEICYIYGMETVIIYVACC